MVKREWKPILLIFSISCVLVLEYYEKLIPSMPKIESLHNKIINGVAPEPYNYRILVPWINEFTSDFFTLITSSQWGLAEAYIIYFIISMFLMFISLYIFQRIWFKKSVALVGILFVASTISVTFKDHYYQPWTMLEVVFFTMSFWCIYKNKFKLLILIVILASFNRSTAMFIPMAYFFVNVNSFDVKKEWRVVLRTIVLSSIWVVIFLGLRFFLDGAKESLLTLEKIRNINEAKITYTFQNLVKFFGILWIFSLFGIRKAPKFIKRLSIIIPVYISLISIYGIWHEVRLLMPLYPILIVLAMNFIFDKQKEKF